MSGPRTIVRQTARVSGIQPFSIIFPLFLGKSSIRRHCSSEADARRSPVMWAPSLVTRRRSRPFSGMAPCAWSRQGAYICDSWRCKRPFPSVWGNTEHPSRGRDLRLPCRGQDKGCGGEPPSFRPPGAAYPPQGASLAAIILPVSGDIRTSCPCRRERILSSHAYG